jgi:hypothetical protein
MVQFPFALSTPVTGCPTNFLSALAAFCCGSPKRIGPTESPDSTTVRSGEVTAAAVAAEDDPTLPSAVMGMNAR